MRIVTAPVPVIDVGHVRLGGTQRRQEPRRALDLIGEAIADQMLENGRYLFVTVAVLVVQRRSRYDDTTANDLQVFVQHSELVADNELALTIAFVHWPTHGVRMSREAAERSASR